MNTFSKRNMAAKQMAPSLEAGDSQAMFESLEDRRMMSATPYAPTTSSNMTNVIVSSHSSTSSTVLRPATPSVALLGLIVG